MARFFFLLMTLVVSVLAAKVTYKAQYHGGAGEVTATAEISAQKAKIVLQNMYGWSGGKFGSTGAGGDITVYAQADVASKVKALAELKAMAHQLCVHVGVCEPSKRLAEVEEADLVAVAFVA